MKKVYILFALVIYGALLNGQTNTFPTSGNVGIGTTNPIHSLQIGSFNGGSIHQLVIPGVYNFEQIRLGQIGNGNSALEFVNHISTNNSYGIRFLVDTDHGAKGLQLQYSGSTYSYGGLIYQTGFYMNPEGGVGINTTAVPSEYKLAVAGNMIAESVKVKLQGAWPDFVFAKDYKLPSLQSTEQHIKEKGHLPGIPSAVEVKANGVDLGEMNAKLLQKIEELTLYLIDMKKEISTQKEQSDKQIDSLKKENNDQNKKLQSEIDFLKTKHK